MQRLFVRIVRPGGVFYDIGANVGFYSLLASELILPGKVFAFEPSPENVQYLRSHLEINKITNVKILALALCDKQGQAFFASEATGSMGHLATVGGFQVQTSTLDSLLQSREILPPDYIKMDIEGAELSALRGAQECFEKYHPVLFLATHGKEIHDECCRLLRSWNYHLKVVRDQSADRAELFARFIR